MIAMNRLIVCSIMSIFENFFTFNTFYSVKEKFNLLEEKNLTKSIDTYFLSEFLTIFFW